MVHDVLHVLRMSGSPLVLLACRSHEIDTEATDVLQQCLHLTVCPDLCVVHEHLESLYLKRLYQRHVMAVAVHLCCDGWPVYHELAIVHETTVPGVQAVHR